LGVSARELKPQEKSLAPGGSGVIVESVDRNSPAYKAGVRVGHVVTQIGGKKISSVEGLQQALQEYSVGDSTTLSFGRVDENGRVQVSTTIRF
jgi:S1-C subfamily serine protease